MKNNIRSIRFSDELADLIDRQMGRTFTEKFENLVTRCVWELPQKEAELKQIQEQINRERQHLRELQQKPIRPTCVLALSGITPVRSKTVSTLMETMPATVPQNAPLALKRRQNMPRHSRMAGGPSHAVENAKR